MAKFKKGDKVEQIVTPIYGEVTDFLVDRETGDVQVKVDYIGADGEPASRYFKEDDLKAG